MLGALPARARCVVGAWSHTKYVKSFKKRTLKTSTSFVQRNTLQDIYMQKLCNSVCNKFLTFCRMKQQGNCEFHCIMLAVASVAKWLTVCLGLCECKAHCD